jgi:hypothetical protein
MSATSSPLAIKCRWLKVPVLWKEPTSRASITTDAGGRSFQLDARREASVIRAASLNLPAAALHLSEFRAIEASICRVGVPIQEGRGLSAPPSVSHHYPADRRHRTGEAGVGQRCLPGPKWRLEMHHRVFRMVAVWAFEGARIVARRMGLNPREHHHRSALGT